MAGFMKNAMSYLGMSDVPIDEDVFTQEAQNSSFDSDTSVTPITPTTSSSSSTRESTASTKPAGQSLNRITTIHPKTYDDAQMVGRALRDGVPVVLNLTDVPETVAYRIVDFSAGVVFGVRGSIERVTPRVFLLSPQRVNINVEDAASKSPARDLFDD